MTIKALTVRPLWAMLIALNEKDYETRSWSTTFRGDLMIHASARVSTLEIPFSAGAVLFEVLRSRYIRVGPATYGCDCCKDDSIRMFKNRRSG